MEPSMSCVYRALYLMTFLTACQVESSMDSRRLLMNQATFSVHGGVVRDPLYLSWS